MDFWMSLFYEPHDQLIAHAQLAERLGFRGVVMPDHVVIKDGPRTPHPDGYPLRPEEPYLDPIVAFAAMAQATTTLQFMPYVFVVPLRDPFLLAKQIGTLALMSDNRFVLGTGVGWLREESDAIRQAWHTRGARLDEMLDVMTALWSEGYVEYHGKHYDVDRSGMFPVPTRPVPVLIGGHSDAAARRAARFDGYMPMRPPTSDEVRVQFAIVDEARAERGATGPFERITHWFGDEPAELDHLGSMGVTGVFVMPWPMYADLSLEEKHAAAERWAATFIRPSGVQKLIDGGSDLC